MTTRPVAVRVSQATRAYGSCSRQASRMASETWSAILSGWPSVTDSEVNRNLSEADKGDSLEEVRIRLTVWWRNPAGNVALWYQGGRGSTKGSSERARTGREQGIGDREQNAGRPAQGTRLCEQ